MLLLGNLSEDMPKLQWYILAFQEKWIASGEYYTSALDALKELNTEEANSFLKTINYFYPSKENNQDAFHKLGQAYEDGIPYESYLSKTERDLKNAKFTLLSGNLAMAGYFFDKEQVGKDFSEERRRRRRACSALSKKRNKS